MSRRVLHFQGVRSVLVLTKFSLCLRDSPLCSAVLCSTDAQSFIFDCYVYISCFFGLAENSVLITKTNHKPQITTVRSSSCKVPIIMSVLTKLEFVQDFSIIPDIKFHVRLPSCSV